MKNNKNIWSRGDGLLVCYVCASEHDCGILCWCCAPENSQFWNYEGIMYHLEEKHGIV